MCDKYVSHTWWEKLIVYPDLRVYEATYFHINEKKVRWPMLYLNHKVPASHTWKPQFRKKTCQNFATMASPTPAHTCLEAMILVLTILQQAPFCHNPMTPFAIGSILCFSIQVCQDSYMVLSSSAQLTLWRSTDECLQHMEAWSYKQQAPTC